MGSQHDAVIFSLPEKIRGDTYSNLTYYHERGQ